MKGLAYFASLTIFLLFFSCSEPANSGENGSVPNGELMDSSSKEEVQSPNPDNTPGDSVAPENLQDCEIKGKTFDKNIMRMDNIAQMISIQADQSTYDNDLGESHRILEVLNTADCSELLKKTLPINRSPDFPYYLAPGTYEPKNKIVAIQGFENFYYYDTEKQNLSPALVPDFMGEVQAVDAQSGMIKGLTTWGHFLLGYAVDFGPFAFDIQDKSNPKPVLPVAKYNVRNTEEYRYLFLLDDGANRFQAIIPNTDIEAGGNSFELQKLFTQALDVDKNIPKNVQNNRYIVLLDKTDGQGKRVVIDMFAQRLVDLPADIATKKVSEILEWLKDQ